MLEKRSGTIAGKLVNLSGRQRMLSQRIAKIYLLETWGLASEQLKQQSKQAQSDFESALTVLMNSEVNTKQINDELAKVHKQWQVFKISHFSQKYNTQVPNLVVRATNKIRGNKIYSRKAAKSAKEASNRTVMSVSSTPEPIPAKSTDSSSPAMLARIKWPS